MVGHVRRAISGGFATAVLAAALAVVITMALPASAAPFSDNFNRADSTDLGAGWTEVAQNTMAISGNRLTNPDDSEALAQAVGATGTVAEADVSAESGANYVAMVLDMAADPGDNVFVKAQDNNGDGSFDTVYFYRGNNGDPGTADYTVAVTPFASGHMRVGRLGNQVRVTVNTDGDAEFEVDLARTYTTLGTGTGVGIGIFGGAAADNFASSNPVATTTTLTSAPNPSDEGESTTFTATVSGGAGGTLAGSVVFNIDGSNSAPVALSSGEATLTTSTLTAGHHAVTATFTATDPFSAGSTSASHDHLVIDATTTTVSSSDNPSIEGDPVTFTAVVAADTGTPTGSIVFTVDGTAGAPIPMSGGQASLSTSVLTVGDHTISAAYTSNDAEVADSASSDLTQTVEPAPRPDARIRRANRPLVGEDVYNTTGAGQTSSGNGRARQTLVFTISVQNDGEVTESILLHGQGSTNRFGVTYRDAIGVNITRQVIDGTYRLRQVTPGSARRVTASVLIRPATTPGQTLSRLVTTTSVRSHAFTDVVRFVTRRSP
jgi:hypothetical protein